MIRIKEVTEEACKVVCKAVIRVMELYKEDFKGNKVKRFCMELLARRLRRERRVPATSEAGGLKLPKEMSEKDRAKEIPDRQVADAGQQKNYHEGEAERYASKMKDLQALKESLAVPGVAASIIAKEDQMDHDATGAQEVQRRDE